MSLRDALDQSLLLTMVALAAMAWTVVTMARVLGQFDYWAPEAAGTTPGAGIVGLLVMGVGLMFAIGVFASFGHDQPTAETWPPEDATVE